MPAINHTENLLQLLVTQFRNGKHIAGLIRALASEASLIETELTKLLLERSLQIAAGQQLDGIGTILVLPRNGRDDDTYRQYLMAKIYFNSQSGEAETLIAALKAITEAARIQYWENHPASCQLFTDGELIFTGLPAFIESMSAGGVGKIPITVSKGEVPTFLLDTVPESNEPGEGWNRLIADRVPAPIGRLLLDDGYFLLDDNHNLLVALPIDPDSVKPDDAGGHYCAALQADNTYEQFRLLLDDGYLLLDNDDKVLLAQPTNHARWYE